MKVFATTEETKKLWEAEGATLAKSINDNNLHLIHIGDRASQVDGFLCGKIKEVEGDVLRDMRELLVIRFAMKNGIPLVATGEAAKLLALATDNTIKAASFNTGKRFILCYSQTGLPALVERELARQLAPLNFEFDFSFSIMRNSASRYKVFNVVQNAFSSDTHVLSVPHFNFLMFQPPIEANNTPKENREFFFDLINEFCIDTRI
jgi:hypothetical protein